MKLKRHLTLFIFLALMTVAHSQVPRFEKTPVGGSGCSVYFPEGGIQEFEHTYSEDSSDVWVLGWEDSQGFTWSLIVVRFRGEIGNDRIANEELLESYLDFLQSRYSVRETAGIGKGHTMESDNSFSGMIDYWLFEDGTKMSIAGWVNPEYIFVYSIEGSEEYPYPNAWQLFRNGIRCN